MSLSGIGQLLLTHATLSPKQGAAIAAVAKSAELPNLTEAQCRIIKAVSDTPNPQLLLGITGSGKTRIYTELANTSLRNGRSVLILSPEIGISEQAFTTLKKSLDSNIYSVHSALPKSQKQKIWQEIAASKTPLIIVSPRSGLFLPIKNLGLIVMDECHDDSYKQSSEPRYHSLHMASLLAKEHDAQLVCGSATPNVTDFYHFSRAGYPIHILKEKALREALRPKIIIVDQNQSKNTYQLVSKDALNEIKASVAEKKQALVFYNRRGTCRLIRCTDCSWVHLCDACDRNMVLHQDKQSVVCHNCHNIQKPLSVCPDCSSVIAYTVPGIKRLTSELEKVFPGVNILRFDSDNNRKKSLGSMVKDVAGMKQTILIGTQIIAKGLDLPLLKTVVIVRAEQSLSYPDYRAEERYFQQITQLIGRVGRGHIRDTSVVIQTYSPTNPTLLDAIDENWLSFYDRELGLRNKFQLPPFRYMANVYIKRRTRLGAIRASEIMVQRINTFSNTVRVAGPAPALIEKNHNGYTWVIQVTDKSRSLLVELSKTMKSNEYFDIDPLQLY